MACVWSSDLPLPAGDPTQCVVAAGDRYRLRVDPVELSEPCEAGVAADVVAADPGITVYFEQAGVVRAEINVRTARGDGPGAGPGDGLGDGLLSELQGGESVGGEQARPDHRPEPPEPVGHVDVIAVDQ